MPTIRIKGMSCQHCARSVTEALNKIEGVKNVRVDLDGGEAVFDTDKPVDSSVIREAIRNAGYEVI